MDKWNRLFSNHLVNEEDKETVCTGIFNALRPKDTSTKERMNAFIYSSVHIYLIWGLKDWGKAEIISDINIGGHESLIC